MWCCRTALSEQRLGLAVDQGEHVQVERRRHRGVLEQVVQHLVRVDVLLELDVDPHAVAIGLVAQVGDALDPLAVDELGDLLHERRLVHLVGQLGHDDRGLARAGLLECDLGPDDDPAAAVGVHLADGVDRLLLAGERVAPGLVAEQRAAGREVRAEDVGAQLVGRQLRVVDQGDRGVDDLAEVMRRDVRGHPDGDPRRAVDQQVRQLGREDRRLLLRPVVVRDEVDGLLVDVGEHLGRDRRQASLRVAHRGRTIAVDRAEVALAVDERVAHREVLGEPDEGVVQRDIAVRVVLAHDLADDRRALAVGAGAAEAHLAHRVEDPAVDGLEAVADIGQRTGHDHAHRVIEVAHPHLVLDADGADVADVVGHGLASPGSKPGIGEAVAVGGRSGQPGCSGEPGGGRHRLATWMARRAAGGCPSSRPRSAAARSAGAWPARRGGPTRGGRRAVAAATLGLTLDERQDGARVDHRRASGAPRRVPSGHRARRRR